MLSCDNLTLAPELTRKFAGRFTRPFNIIGKAGPVAYKLGLPEEMKVHPVFHVSLLRKYLDPDKVFSGRQVHSHAPTLTDKGVENTVESILSKGTSHGTAQYYVRWSGCGALGDSWLSQASQSNSQRLLHEFGQRPRAKENGNAARAPPMRKQRDLPDVV